MAKKNDAYFSDFNAMIECSCLASKHLHETLADFNPQSLPEKRTQMHEIEHGEDMIRHNLMERLAKDFITPLDREDIISLTDELDNITDQIEDILIRMYMYNVQSIRPEAVLMSDIIGRCCEALRQAFVEFPDFRKSKTLRERIIEVNTIEEEGDKLYIKAVRNLYMSDADPIEIFVWSTLFDLFENCCDACEHVANLVGTATMKNT